MNKTLMHTSKFISLVLRHKPEEIGLQLDENGWADVNELIEKMNRKGGKLDREKLNEIVATNEKKRFAFNEDHTKIRASQGHSIEVDVQLPVAIPPDVLFHGTAEKNVEAILAEGLVRRNRLHVHLSDKPDTATQVGQRHGKPVLLLVNAKAMHNEGLSFYLSANGVWLADEVPAQYLSKYSG
jgi:putative RNA 2'-phosphotransferase